jgi:hypothetical protein
LDGPASVCRRVQSGATSAAPTQAALDPTVAGPPAATTPPVPTQASVVTPPVAIAIISAYTARAVSWTDGKLVAAQANNVTVEALAGAAHQHSAALSPNIRYYKFQGPDGLLLDDNGNGTVPCDRQTEASLVIDNQGPTSSILQRSYTGSRVSGCGNSVAVFERWGRVRGVEVGDGTVSSG